MILKTLTESFRTENNEFIIFLRSLEGAQV